MCMSSNARQPPLKSLMTPGRLEWPAEDGATLMEPEFDWIGVIAAEIHHATDLLWQLLSEIPAALTAERDSELALTAMRVVVGQLDAEALVDCPEMDGAARQAVRRTAWRLREVIAALPPPPEGQECEVEAIVRGLEWVDEVFIVRGRVRPVGTRTGRPPNLDSRRSWSWVETALWLLDVSDTPVWPRDVAHTFHGSATFPESGYVRGRNALVHLAALGEAVSLGPKAGWYTARRPVMAIPNTNAVGGG